MDRLVTSRRRVGVARHSSLGRHALAFKVLPFALVTGVAGYDRALGCTLHMHAGRQSHDRWAWFIGYVLSLSSLGAPGKEK